MKCLAQRGNWNLSEVQLRQLEEKIFFHKLQKKYFHQELNTLNKGSVPKTINPSLFLRPDGLIGCRSRLQHTPIEWDAAHPILLPRQSHMTLAILTTLHRENAHLSANHLVARLRQRFWVPKVRTIANKVVKNCWECKRLYRGAYRLPPMPPLPVVRVADVAPFFYTEVDYFGPIQIAITLR